MKTAGKIEKIYYTIGEVAELFEVNTSLIRFWENEFDFLKPLKNKKGNRLFTKKDLNNIRIIYHLVKEKGYTLQGAREKIKQNKEGLEKNVEIIETLQQIRQYLLDIKAEL